MRQGGDHRRFAYLYEEMSKALAKSDWMRISKVDLEIREFLLGLAAGGVVGAESSVHLQPLKQLHVQALGACSRESRRIANVLSQHVEHGEARRAYSQIDSLQEQ